MKKGYKRLLIFLIILISLLLLDTFVINILSGYKMVLFLIFLIILFNELFVLEKERHRYKNDIYIEVFFSVLIFYSFYYILGLIIGLAKTPNYYTLNGITSIIVPIILYVILKEVLRYNMIQKADGNNLDSVLVVILFIMIEISNKYAFYEVKNQFDMLRVISLALLPAISSNIAYSYVSKKVGYKPVIIFDLIISLFAYLIPIIPNPNEYVASLVYIILPAAFAYRVLRFFELKNDEEIPSNYHKKRLQITILPMILIVVLVYFYSGYFKYYAIAIASGSMKPNINKGDITVVDQKYKKIKVNDVIAYKKENTIIVHRVVKKTDVNGTSVYYTKGDANNNIDNIAIYEDMIVGKVKFRIPYIGYPTIWFNIK